MERWHQRTQRFVSMAFALAILVGFTTYNAHSAALSAVGLVWASVPFALALLITRRPRLSAWLAVVLCTALYLLSRIKIHYYKETLLASDAYLIADPSNWQTVKHYPLAAIPLIVIAAGIVLLAVAYRREPHLGFRNTLTVSLLAAFHAAGAYALSRDSDINTLWQASLPNGKNPYINLVMSMRMQLVPPNPRGDGSRFEARMHDLPARASGARPDIVVWLQESTVDPRRYDLPTSQLPRLRMLEIDSRTHVTGPLRVHTYGGGTWRSEFALFTGLPSSDFGVAASAVFYVVTPHLTHSLFRELRQHGYRSVVLTPFNKSAYHARAAYADMGADIVLQPQDLGYPAEPSDNLWNISSAEMAAYAAKVLERYADKPIFLFMLTIKEHAPYDSSHRVAYGLEQLADRALAGRLSDYFSRLEELDKATQSFADAFLAPNNHPRMFMYFGDHLPAIDAPSLGFRISVPEPHLVTQFVLRDNLPQPAGETRPLTDIAYLGGLLLERAGLPVSRFYSANITVRKACDGGLADCPNQQLVADYQDYIYRRLQVLGPLPPARAP